MTMLCRQSQLASSRSLSLPSDPKVQAADNQNHLATCKTAANEAVTLHSAALPDLVCTATSSIAPDQPIAVLPLGHPWLSLIAQLEPGSLVSALMPRLYQACPNSPDSFCTVTALQSISPNELILAIPPMIHHPNPRYRSSANSMAVVCTKMP